MSRRGGVLLDLFLILVILATAAWGWLTWKRGRIPWPASLPSFLSLPLPGASAPPAAEPDIDVSDRSAGIQGDVRELLVRHGVSDKHVLKTFNAQRQEGGIQWLEDTLAVRRPAVFDEGSFLRALAPRLAERRLVLMDDRREGGRWVLALGDRKRVYQKLIFESSR